MNNTLAYEKFQVLFQHPLLRRGQRNIPARTHARQKGQ